MSVKWGQLWTPFPSRHVSPEAVGVGAPGRKRSLVIRVPEMSASCMEALCPSTGVFTRDGQRKTRDPHAQGWRPRGDRQRPDDTATRHKQPELPGAGRGGKEPPQKPGGRGAGGSLGHTLISDVGLQAAGEQNSVVVSPEFVVFYLWQPQETNTVDVIKKLYYAPLQLNK